MEHIQLIENDIKMHGKSIMQDISDALAAYKKEDYEGFGFIMGNVMKIATDAKAAKKTEALPKDISPKEKREKMAEIYQGFFEGTGVGSFNFTDLLLCIYQADQSAIALYEGVKQLDLAW